jgi:hypothetical protein
MTQLDIPVANLVRNLRSVGLRPPDRLVEQIVSRGDEAVAPLLELALDTERLDDEEPGSLGPVHALRLLGELRPLHMAEPILRAIPLPSTLEPAQGMYLWQQEVPQIVARLGADVLPTLLAIVDNEAADAEQRGAAVETLGYLGATTPELCAELADHLRTRWATITDPTVRGYMVEALAELGAKDMYAPVMAAYREGSVDRDVMTAAEARQVLLSGNKDSRTSCANHTLVERYEQHGPYSEEQRRAMAEMQRMMNERR